MSKIGKYDYLEPVQLPLDLDILADLLVKSNFGVHRFLSALVRSRKRTERKNDQLMQEIERLIEEGEY